MFRWARYSGVAASAIFWIFTTASISVNKWFNFLRDAFSDLGGPEANYPWIYNLGLVLSSIALMIFSIHMIYYSKSRIGVVAGSYFSVASIFLALIAVFPAGTRPHVFVSTWFFIQAFLESLIYGVSIYRSDKLFAKIIFIIFILGILGALIKWPSASSVESYEIILLTVFAILYALRSG